MILDSQVKDASQPYTYRQWIHDACAVEYGDKNHYTDEQLDSMSDRELDELFEKLLVCGEGSNQEWNGTH